jgi:hypothetical protein
MTPHLPSVSVEQENQNSMMCNVQKSVMISHGEAHAAGGHRLTVQTDVSHNINSLGCTLQQRKSEGSLLQVNCFKRCSSAAALIKPEAASTATEAHIFCLSLQTPACMTQHPGHFKWKSKSLFYLFYM